MNKVDSEYRSLFQNQPAAARAVVNTLRAYGRVAREGPTDARKTQIQNRVGLIAGTDFKRTPRQQNNIVEFAAGADRQNLQIVSPFIRGRRIPGLSFPDLL
jgi:hypothetical protein